MFCTNCGAQLDDGAQFCTACGCEIDGTADANAASEQGMQYHKTTTDQRAQSHHAKTRSVITIAIAAAALVICVAVIVLALPRLNSSVESSSADSQGEVASGQASDNASTSAASAGAAETGQTFDAASEPALSQEAAASGQTSSATSASTATSTAINNTPTIAEYDLYRVSLPPDAASKVTFSTGEKEANVVDLSVGDTVIARIIGAQALGPHGQDERKFETYDLGETPPGSEKETISLNVYYISESGSGNVHWGDSSATEFACQELLGMTPDQLIDCIAVKGANGAWVKAAHNARGGESSSVSQSAGQDNPDGSLTGQSVEPSYRESPFWGIWIGASKDYNEAEAIAAEARGKNLDASVTMTTDWYNLNSEPWYVITAGRYGSEDDAYGHLDYVHSVGYGDAYVKYSGEHK